ncbi:hypothetical protein BHM03_00011763 [Ensete ventricosum]|nr:hypothetical protein BHM03_00011763 [Ensete ventricosum]
MAIEAEAASAPRPNIDWERFPPFSPSLLTVFFFFFFCTTQFWGVGHFLCVTS